MKALILAFAILAIASSSFGQCQPKVDKYDSFEKERIVQHYAFFTKSLAVEKVVFSPTLVIKGLDTTCYIEISISLLKERNAYVVKPTDRLLFVLGNDSVIALTSAMTQQEFATVYTKNTNLLKTKYSMTKQQFKFLSHTNVQKMRIELGDVNVDFDIKGEKRLDFYTAMQCVSDYNFIKDVMKKR